MTMHDTQGRKVADQERQIVRARIRGPDVIMLRRWGIILLLATGGVCLAQFLWYEWKGRYFQSSLSHAFDEQRQRSGEIPPDEGGTTAGPPFEREASGYPPSAEGMPDVVGRLEIPRIGVEVMVLNGADPSALRRGAAWLPDTARPGAGNAAIAAHRDTHFRPLRQIQEGDVVRLTTLHAGYNFRVEWTAVVDPDDTAVLGPTGKPALTLITCYPFHYVGKAPRRFIVRASRQDPL